MIRAGPPGAPRIKATARTRDSTTAGATASSPTRPPRGFAEAPLERDESRGPLACTVVDAALGPPWMRLLGVGANAPLRDTPIAPCAVRWAPSGRADIRLPALGMAEIAAPTRFVDGFATAADLAFR